MVEAVAVLDSGNAVYGHGDGRGVPTKRRQERSVLAMSLVVVLVLTPGALGVAAAATKKNGAWFGSLTGDAGQCVNVGLVAREYHLQLMKERADREFREPTKQDLALVGDGYRLIAWNDDALSCHGIEPTEAVVTDEQRKVRIRFPLVSLPERTAKLLGTAALAGSILDMVRLLLPNAAVGQYFRVSELTTTQLNSGFSSPGQLHVVSTEGVYVGRFDLELARVWMSDARYLVAYLDYRGPFLVGELKEACVTKVPDTTRTAIYVMFMLAVSRLQGAIEEGIDVRGILKPFEACLKGVPVDARARKPADELLGYLLGNE